MKTFTAVLHLKSKDPVKVYQLGGKVYSNLTLNASIFLSPNPDLGTFNGELTKLDTLIKSKDGSKQKTQAISDQVEVVHGYLKSYITYVNKVAQGDKTIILQSGFDCNNEPVSRGIPDKALIKRIEDGSTAQSAKIYVEALEDADRYKVEMTNDLNSTWTTVLDHGTLNKLEINGMERGKEVFYRVSGGNIYGWGIPSEPVSFIPR